VGSVSVAGILLAVVAAGIGEYAGPAGDETAQNLQHRARYGSAAQALPDGVWLRHADTVVRIGGMPAPGHITDIDVYRMDDSRHLQVAMHAKQGRLGADGMLLDQPQVTRISLQGTRVEQPEQLQVGVKLGSDVLALAAVDPDEQSSLDLVHYIRYLQANHLDASDYKLALWRNI